MSKNINDYNRCLTRHPDKINAIASMYFNILRQNPDHELTFPVAYIKEYLTTGKIVREGASKQMKDQAILIATNGFLGLDDQALIQDSSMEHLQTAFHYLKNESIVDFVGRSCYKLTDIGKNINSVPSVPTVDGRESEVITGKFVSDKTNTDTSPLSSVVKNVDNSTGKSPLSSVTKSVFLEVMNENLQLKVEEGKKEEGNKYQPVIFSEEETILEARKILERAYPPTTSPVPVFSTGLKNNILQKITEPLKLKIQSLKTKVQELAKIVMSYKEIIREKEDIIKEKDKVIKEREEALMEIADLPEWIKGLSEEIEGL